MTEHYVSYNHKAPYYTLNRLDQTTRRVWIVFHGYGQLSKFFIRKFTNLDETNFIIVPQGLSKFYLKGFNGRVGATWMTKEDRMTDIENQMTYIDTVLGQFPQLKKVSVNYFGFSQGVATMIRYAAHAKWRFDKMVVWAGTVPPELTSKDFAFLSGKEAVDYYTGNDDPFYKPGIEREQVERVKELMGIDAGVHFFEGTHEVPADMIKDL